MADDEIHLSLHSHDVLRYLISNKTYKIQYLETCRLSLLLWRRFRLVYELLSDCSCCIAGILGPACTGRSLHWDSAEYMHCLLTCYLYIVYFLILHDIIWYGLSVSVQDLHKTYGWFYCRTLHDVCITAGSVDVLTCNPRCTDLLVNCDHKPRTILLDWELILLFWQLSITARGLLVSPGITAEK